MRSAYRISPRLVTALIIAGAILIGWVARSTRAQDGAKASSPAVPSETTKAASDTVLPTPRAHESTGSGPALEESAFHSPEADVPPKPEVLSPGVHSRSVPIPPGARPPGSARTG